MKNEPLKQFQNWINESEKSLETPVDRYIKDVGTNFIPPHIGDWTRIKGSKSFKDIYQIDLSDVTLSIYNFAKKNINIDSRLKETYKISKYEEWDSPLYAKTNKDGTIELSYAFFNFMYDKEKYVEREESSWPRWSIKSEVNVFMIKPINHKIPVSFKVKIYDKDKFEVVSYRKTV